MPLVGWRPGENDRLDDLLIHVEQRCHLQIDLGDRKSRATSFAVLDARGENVRNVAIHGTVWWFPTTVDIVDGKSEASATESRGTTVVRFKDGVEVERVPVTLKPNALVTPRP